MPRNQTIDILRGIAVFTMVAANLAGNVLAEPHPLLFRFYGTFSAPMFVLLSGMMVARQPERGLHYFLGRGSLVVAVGMLIDLLIWQYYPMVSFDVLYLIGTAMPLVHLAGRLPATTQWMLALGIFIVTPLVQYLFGYVPVPLDWPIREHRLVEFIAQPPDIVGHFFADGWFPFFPWIGFALLGGCLHRRWQMRGEGFISELGRSGCVLLTLGLLVWFAFPGPLYTRSGYSEMFYPPTYGYTLSALGVVFLAFYQVDRWRHLAFWRPWRQLGQCALFAYILQYTLIHYLFAALWPKAAFPPFVLMYAALILILFAVAEGLRRYKEKHPQSTFLLRFLIGG